MELTRIPAEAPAETGRVLGAVPLRPALFARYAALEELRYDYPLVLIDGDGDDDGPLIRPLSRIFDDILKLVAPANAAGEILRQQVLRLEMAIRLAVAQGEEGRLSDLWRICTADLVRDSGEAAFGPLDTNLDKARSKLTVDGQVIGCDGDTPGVVLRHAWNAKQWAKAHRFRKTVDRLVLRLNDILKSDHMKSDEAHGPEALAAAMGATAEGSIDFTALSHVLDRARPEDRLPEDRVRRIEGVLGVLQCQPFFGPGRASHCSPGRRDPYSYTFDTCSAALDAYRHRLPDVVEFTKALAIAEMEVENKYVPELHDAVFETFDESDLTPEQIRMLPSALVCLRDGETESAEIARTYEALAFGLPITVLIQVDDVLGPTSPEPPHNSFGAGTARLATMAMGLNNAFVCQCTSAHLYRMEGVIRRGMHYDGPALFTVYSGATPSMRDVPAYVLAAAATESRAFPSFTYDPSAGGDLAARFDLTHNPQVEADWPEHRIDFEDGQGQRQSETLAFTFADFAICDARYRRFCHPVARAGWTAEMVPAAEWLKLSPAAEDGRSPYVAGLEDGENMVRTVVDGKITAAARACNDAWRRLQELAGINNSHVLRALMQERQDRAAAAREAVADVPAAAPPAAAAEPASMPEPPAAEAETAPDGLPWIETARCTTCNECVQINSALFGYNENRQAFIADPDAGTYRQLVEAAEGCQVSIIHPGKPRNPDEPNLDELLERAEPFN